VHVNRHHSLNHLNAKITSDVQFVAVSLPRKVLQGFQSIVHESNQIVRPVPRICTLMEAKHAKGLSKVSRTMLTPQASYYAQATCCTVHFT
jgi:hypothetical protein